jgi:hypothetical protein
MRQSVSSKSFKEKQEIILSQKHHASDGNLSRAPVYADYTLADTTVNDGICLFETATQPTYENPSHLARTVSNGRNGPVKIPTEAPLFVSRPTIGAKQLTQPPPHLLPIFPTESSPSSLVDAIEALALRLPQLATPAAGAHCRARQTPAADPFHMDWPHW